LVPDKALKGQTQTIKITGIGSEGQGVGHLGNGYTVFVPGALPDETVSVLIISVKASYCVGKLMEIVTASQKRVEPACPVSGKCGGCSLLHCAYPYQLELKQRLLEQTFTRIGKFTNPPIMPIIGMSNPYRYRNKSSFPIGTSDTAPVIGFYSKRSHRIIPITDCLVDHMINARIIQCITEYIRRIPVSVYDENNHSGLLRHVLLRIGFSTNEVMVCLVINGQNIPGIPVLIDLLKTNVPGFTTLVLNINKARTNVIMGNQTYILYGPGVIRDTIGELCFEISPTSFYQINPIQTKVLYDTALSFACLTGKESIVEAYSGIGTISLFLARKAKHVYAVEIVAAAVKDAKRNAFINGISNVSFYNESAETWLPEFCVRQQNKPDICVLDPPRKGCAAVLLQAVAAIPVKKVIYVSCNMGTLARDARLLTDLGYTLSKLQPVDMFPQTPDVECVALFDR